MADRFKRKDRAMSAWKGWLSREDGQDLAEYALVAAVISAGIVAAIGPVAAALVVKFAYIASRLNSAP